ncbi:hypothetical protein [Actinomadura rudentiformis]|uniref:DUF3040 domain-containing protein n=1 Tax=Actinomadura rudentiformis TaxID=359158 RepID=A0A6H9YCA3_9ACTN|nr:hypothetical protein [Actinomadura rudentiformis]KAB2341631.1 hypothetical protein F8566_41635 [Actinomadura rudentiformis]
MTLDPDELRALRALEHHVEQEDPVLAALLAQGRSYRKRPGLHPPYWPASSTVDVRTWIMAFTVIGFLFAFAMVGLTLSQGG